MEVPGPGIKVEQPCNDWKTCFAAINKQQQNLPMPVPLILRVINLFLQNGWVRIQVRIKPDIFSRLYQSVHFTGSNLIISWQT